MRNLNRLILRDYCCAAGAHYPEPSSPCESKFPVLLLLETALVGVFTRLLFSIPNDIPFFVTTKTEIPVLPSILHVLSAETRSFANYSSKTGGKDCTLQYVWRLRVTGYFKFQVCCCAAIVVVVSFFLVAVLFRVSLDGHLRWPHTVFKWLCLIQHYF